jgi:hypothetical protein
MPWFSSKAQPRIDLVTAEDVARFGRFSFLGPAAADVSDASAALRLLEPLRSQLYGDEKLKRAAIDEMERHASQGRWEAVGAWKFGEDFIDDAAYNASVTDLGLLALADMRVTNLAIHLGHAYLTRYEELTGAPASNDGFWGPPIFDSAFGPTRQYYFDQAISAAAQRRPTRIPSAPGITAPSDLPGLWDFGMLVLRGPALVSTELRFEPSTLREAIKASTGVDHSMLVEQLRALLETEAKSTFNGWSCMGAARFIEDYLDPSLTAGPAHTALIDLGLAQLRANGMLGNSFPVETLSWCEQQRLGPI